MPVKKHWSERGAVYHITFKTRSAQRFLASNAAKEVVLQTIDAYRKRLGYDILGYAVLDTHLHAVVAIRENTTLGQIVRTWKGLSARTLQTLLNRKGSIWQDRYADNYIRTHRELLEVLEYIHNNPLKAGIVSKQTEYAWSSARAYAGQSSGICQVNTDSGAG